MFAKQSLFRIFDARKGCSHCDVFPIGLQEIERQHKQIIHVFPADVRYNQNQEGFDDACGRMSTGKVVIGATLGSGPQSKLLIEEGTRWCVFPSLTEPSWCRACRDERRSKLRPSNVEPFEDVLEPKSPPGSDDCVVECF